MKQKYYLLFFLVSLAWFAFTLCPPWKVTCFHGQGLPIDTQFCGYGFIFAPPDAKFKTVYEMNIDFVLLSLKYLASLVLISVVTLRIKKPIVVSRVQPFQFKMRLTALSMICVVASVLLLKQEALNQLKVALVPSPCLCAVVAKHDLPAGQNTLRAGQFINRDSLIY